ncbi:MAG: hypothetical protein M3384_08845 [Acidobacteriota bacterium]|nr:hypothetical protein [Acidobacteriota bacterium]
MEIKNILLRLAAAIAAFVFGIGIFSSAEYVLSVFQANEQKTEAGARAGINTLKMEDLIYPRPLAGEIKAFGTELPITNSEPEIKSEPVKEKVEREFDAGNDYYIVGDSPKGFKDFDIFSLTTRNYENASEENNYQGIPIPPEGYVLTTKKFKFVRINVAGKQIAFETEAKKGISYQFVGEFFDEEEEVLRKTADGNEYSEFVILKGRLIKMRDGKKIAESEVRFGIAHGC